MPICHLRLLSFLVLILAGSNALAHGDVPQNQTSQKGDQRNIGFDNDAFYTDGQFDMEKAKDAIVELMEYHGYPVYPGIRDNLIVSDYGTGQFSKLGISIVMWIDSQEDPYMLMDIFLLPNQMLPEHSHRDQDGPLPAKSEAWLVRHGISHIVAEGPDNLGDFSIEIPEVHSSGTAVAKHAVKATPGVVVPLDNSQKSPHHWQFAGPEGAIITEVASHNSLPDTIFSDKMLNEFIQKAMSGQ